MDALAAFSVEGAVFITANQLQCRKRDVKFVSTTVNPNLLQSASHPLFHLQVFSDCTFLCALTEEDSRLFYEVRFYEMVVVVVGGCTKAVTKSEEETLAVSALRVAASLWPLFVV